MRLRQIESLVLLSAKRVLNIHDVALLTGRSEKTIRNRLSEIPHYRGGTGIVFKRDEVERWQLKQPIKPIQ